MNAIVRSRCVNPLSGGVRLTAMSLMHFFGEPLSQPAAGDDASPTVRE